MPLNSLLKCRVKVLIAGILGGGTIIAFPAASAAVVIYVALVLGTIGIMAWTGLIALASAAAVALLLPALAIVAVLAAVAGVRRFIRMAGPRSKVEAFSEHPVPAGGLGSGEPTQVVQEGLDDWETDGGPAAPPRRKAAWRRVRRPDRPNRPPADGQGEQLSAPLTRGR